MEAFAKAVGTVVIVLAVALFFGILTGFPVKWVVNYLFSPEALTVVFGVPKIGFWQAFWLNFLCACLFQSNTTSK